MPQILYVYVKVFLFRGKQDCLSLCVYFEGFFEGITEMNFLQRDFYFKRVTTFCEHLKGNFSLLAFIKVKFGSGW